MISCFFSAHYEVISVDGRINTEYFLKLVNKKLILFDRYFTQSALENKDMLDLKVTLVCFIKDLCVVLHALYMHL